MNFRHFHALNQQFGLNCLHFQDDGQISNPLSICHCFEHCLMSQDSNSVQILRFVHGIRMEHGRHELLSWDIRILWIYQYNLIHPILWIMSKFRIAVNLPIVLSTFIVSEFKLSVYFVLFLWNTNGSWSIPMIVVFCGCVTTNSIASHHISSKRTCSKKTVTTF